METSKNTDCRPNMMSDSIEPNFSSFFSFVPREIRIELVDWRLAKPNSLIMERPISENLDPKF